MSPSLESELKYRAETDATLEALASPPDLGPATLGPANTVEETDRYLDTEGRDLARARWACRLRTREGRTFLSLKGPSQHAPGAALHLRPELEGPANDDPDPASWPPSPARDLLLELTGGAPLSERLALAQRRIEREVAVGGRRVGLLSLDRSRVLHGGREVGVLRVVELELAPAALVAGLDPAPLERALAAIPGLTPDPASKLERALALISEEGA
ncbi:MAG TPA: CYTH domain-containing protein [Candidatus Binatia bacterium]|nr:CYTH domain-containing protein [Candidatus Binatia bacterium]